MFTNCSPLFTFVHQSKKHLDIEYLPCFPVCFLVS
nr:MAG TPA: hypothetical protein [Caudoviricetes sp.]